MLLLSAANEHQIPLAKLTVPLMREYAKRHKLGFRYVPFVEPNVKEAYWKKITLTLQSFEEGFDRVFWLDVDQAITNMEAEFPMCSEGSSFLASRDWGNDAGELDFSMCGFLCTEKSREAFEWVNENKAQFIDGPFPEQTPMREYWKARPPEFYYGLGMLPRRTLNAVPDEVSPGNVPEPWQPGDFSCHLTMLPIEQRVALFHKIMEKVRAHAA